jgi:ABC-type Fe3+-hydroxamate transport system substrate-binding protein
MAVRDQMGFEVTVTSAQRIISLVPSQTELLFDLGLADRIAGVTQFCVHPEQARSKAIVGGTKNFRFDVIHRLQPDLIIGNKEENYEEGILTLQKQYPVWMSDIGTRKDAIGMITGISKITATVEAGNAIIQSIADEFNHLSLLPPLKTLYLIWKKPWMAAGQNTFIHAMLEEIGLVNALKEARYPELTDKIIQLLSPQLILLSSEPYPFREKHMAELQQCVPQAKICLVDGEMFSWYGSRLIKAPGYFNSLRHQLS